MSGSCTNASSMAMTLSLLPRSTRITLSHVCRKLPSMPDTSIAARRATRSAHPALARGGGALRGSRRGRVVQKNTMMTWWRGICLEDVTFASLSRGIGPGAANGAPTRRACERTRVHKTTTSACASARARRSGARTLDHHARQPEGHLLRELLAVHGRLEAVAKVDVQQLAAVAVQHQVAGVPVAQAQQVAHLPPRGRPRIRTRPMQTLWDGGPLWDGDLSELLRSGSRDPALHKHA